LDTLGQGLFSFGPEGLCSSTYSKACLWLLEGSPGGKHIADVLKLDHNSQETIASLLNILFSNSSGLISLDDIFDLFPSEFTHSQGLSVALQYRPIKDIMGAIYSVVVIATNDTEKVHAVQQTQIREEKVLTILRIANNRNIFTNFFTTATKYFTSLEETLSRKVPLEQIRRDIHTLKGNGSIFHLKNFVTMLHGLEESLSGVTTLEQAQRVLLPVVLDVQNALLAIKDEARNILGDDFDRHGAMRSIPLTSLKDFAGHLTSQRGLDDLRSRFTVSFMGEPIQQQLGSFALGLQELADRYGKNINPCEFTGENFSIPTERYQALFDSFAHIVRNIIAHAAEDDLVRADYGKPIEMNVLIDTLKYPLDGKEWMRISFTDDGAGIDVAKLRDKLNLHDPDAVSDQDVMQYIFGDNLSTKDEVDELSGRGAGMSAVTQCAIDLGGTAYVESEPHIFTRIVIEVPLVWV
jgi:two-component system chemotaxis sensor kinase CheA